MTQITVQQALDLAMQHHQAGQLQQAESIYRQVLAAAPNHPDALHLLGVLALQVGQAQPAIELIRKAIEIAPGNAQYYSNLGQALSTIGQNAQAIEALRRAVQVAPNLVGAHNNLGNALAASGELAAAVESYRSGLAIDPNAPDLYNNLGNALKSLGQFDDAVAAYQKSLSLRPDSADAWNNFGALLQEREEIEQAVDAYRRAIQIQPNLPDSHSNLGAALRVMGQLDQAEASCRRALEVNPNFVNAYVTLGNIFIDQKRFDEAIVALNKALELNPEFGEAYMNLGNALRGAGKNDQAIAAYKRAIAMLPNYADAYSNLGKILDETQQFEEAIAACSRAVQLQPNHANAWNNLATALVHSGRLKEGIAAFHQSVAYRPDQPIVHYNLGLAQLQAGDYRQGFAECEWRFNAPQIGIKMPHLRQPRWDGTNPSAKRLLLYAEQGFGDAIQFGRYVPLVAQRGAKVVLVCHPEVMRLMHTLEGVDEYVENGAQLPDFDVHYPLMSLPLVFDTTLETIPAKVPYLHADPELAVRWRERIPTDKKLKIGLVWAGRSEHKNDKNRSLSVATLAPLAQFADAWFCSLQKGEQSHQARSAPMPITDWTDELNNFADTAALIANFDLVITVDTAVAHVAGAIGKPVWILVPFISDWRWLDRSDNPWYPTARIFRQPRLGDWDAPVKSIVQFLEAYYKTPSQHPLSPVGSLSM